MNLHRDMRRLLSWVITMIVLQLLALALFAVCLRSCAASTLDHATVSRMSEAIYRAEGGDKARVPYGVLSVKVKDKAEARRVCENSIRNNWRRWEAAGRPGGDFNGFIRHMASRWCPVASDPQGNANWVRNVTALMQSASRRPKQP